MKYAVPVIILAMLLAGVSTWAADATIGVDVNSSYVWRGITFNDGVVVQPTLDVSKNGFGVSVWGNFDIDDYDDTLDQNDFSEIDLTAYYAFSLDKVDFSVGVISYLFPSSGAEGTLELYGSVRVNIVDGLSAGVNIYWDVDEAESVYGDLGLTYAMDLTKEFSLEVSAKAGYAGEDFARYYSAAATDGGFYDYGFSLGVNYAVTEALTIGAAINYTDSFDDDVLPEADLSNGIYGVDAKVYGGASISYAF